MVLFVKGSVQIVKIVFPFLLFFWFASCVRQDSFPIGKKIICGAEHVAKDKKHFMAANDSSFLLSGAKKQTTSEARSGKHSVYTLPGNRAYAFGFDLKNLKADSYYKVSVWRKTKDGKGVLVVAAKNAKDYYVATSAAVKSEGAWEKLELEVFVPPLDAGKNNFAIYAWNNGSDTVYYDDFKIERFASKTYPGFEEEPLVITLDTAEFLKLYNKRKIALANGILQTGDNDWVKGFVFGDGKMMKAKMRLKGDWLDHLKGDKWSLRIKMRKSNAWNRLRTFSIQTPNARNYLLEWASHNFYESADILTTRYGFVPVYLNSRNRGLFAWEEHFVKQLLESRNRREGPIVKFDEDPFWQIQKLSKKLGGWPQYPFYETAVIRPFSQSKTTENPVLFEQFKNAQILMHQYKNQLMPANRIFDLNKLAAYYAMLDLTHARHGMVWHNQRFYYNPVIGKLEPIAFDGYTDHSKPDVSINDNLAHTIINQQQLDVEQRLFYELFRQKDFLDKYLDYLHEFSNEDFVNTVLENYQDKTVFYDSLLKLEFANYHYDFDFFISSAAAIREYLPELEVEISSFVAENKPFDVKQNDYGDSLVFEDTPEFFVNAYLQETSGDSVSLKVFNYFPRDLIVLGTGRKKKNVSSFQLPEPHIPAFDGSGPQPIDIKTDTGSCYLFFMVDGCYETFRTEINPWPVPEGKTTHQLLRESSDIESYGFVDKIDGTKIFVKPGKLKIAYNIVVPAGYKVYFPPGTEIDIVDSALFISYSPVFMEGTKEKPVKITSSDFSANGFTVLQAEGRSRVENAVFENLNTLNYKGWTLTGALTFYESDVDISNAVFYRNQCEDALNIIRSDFTLENSGFDYIFSDAFDSDFSTGTVSGTKFTNIGNDAIDFSGSEILIESTTIADASDKGISGGEDSHLVVRDCLIERANIGIASKDLSTVTVEKSKVDDCNYGIVLLQKKPEYGPATMVLNNVEFVNAKTKFLIEQGSLVTENGKGIKGDKENVAKLFY